MASKTSGDIIKLIMQRLQGCGFERTLEKLCFVSVEDGKCQAEFTVEPEHMNPGGSLHGGFSATLVDCISTYALMTYGKKVPGVSVDMHITYLKAALEGDDILVDAYTVRSGKTLAFLEVTLKNKKNGQLLVKGSHTKFVGGPA